MENKSNQNSHVNKPVLPSPSQKRASEENKACLSNIAELTEEYDIQKTALATKGGKGSKILLKNQTESESTNFLGGLFFKISNCLVFSFNKLFKGFGSAEMNVNESQISQMLTKLRKRKDKRIHLLPEKSAENSCKKTLVLDLDETLISLTHRQQRNYDFRIEIQSKGKQIQMFLIKRFGLDSFLFQMSQIYEIVIYSSLKYQFVEKIVKLIDPKKYISHILSREHCVVINQSYFVKPVRDLGRNSRSVITVDTYGISASLNPETLYKIQRFRGSAKDRKLIKLGYFLKFLHETLQGKDIISVDYYRKQFESKQIQISSSKDDIMSSRKSTVETEQMLTQAQENSAVALAMKNLTDN